MRLSSCFMPSHLNKHWNFFFLWGGGVGGVVGGEKKEGKKQTKGKEVLTNEP